MPYRNTFTKVFSLETGIAIFVFVGVVGVLTFALVVYRSKRREKPTHNSKNTPLELGYVAAVFGMAVFLVWLSLTNNSHERNATFKKPALVVKVTGFQWCWQFSYEGHDATVQGTCNLGHHLPILVVPTNRPVRFEITSNDVVHEFWLPYLHYKMEAFPDHLNSMTATFTQTGMWEGRCAEFCGLFHDNMEFWVRAVTSARYRSWLSAHHGFHVE